MCYNRANIIVLNPLGRVLLFQNGIWHRDDSTNGPIYFYQYDDWIEIINHGNLYGRENKQNFPKVNDYRNIVVAEAMKVLGFVNRHSRGVRSLISKEEIRTTEQAAKRVHKFNSKIDASVEIFKLGASYWMNVYNALTKEEQLSYGDCDFIRSIAFYIL